MLCTHVDVAASVARTQVVQHGSLVQVGQVGHVLNLLELGRIHLLNRIFLNRFLLQQNTLFQ